jgi:uncharacterized lipoprotein
MSLRKVVIAAVCLFGLAGCSSNAPLSPVQRATLDRAIERAEKPPRRPLTGKELEGLEDLVRKGSIK